MMKSRRTIPVVDGPGLGLEIERPGASARAPISISDLTATIRELLEENLSGMWVAGEISNLRAPGSGHLYFTLKDATATLAAVMFRLEASRIGFSLQDGMAVVARGAITVYESRGQYQLQVAEIRTRGQGGLQQWFEELKKKLQAENLFALERKRSLPVFPESIGVVTSLQGAVLQDILQILQRRAPGIRIFVRGVRVQGSEAAGEIAEAIRAFSDARAVDLLILARGGGSLEDLWAFNEETVARALAGASMPTISAVGHETDFTIADFVADLRAPTPSAAAELLTRDWNDWREVIMYLCSRMGRGVRQVIAGHRRHFLQLAGSYVLREPRRVVRQMAQRLDDLREELRAAAAVEINQRRQRLERFSARLKNRHPARELEKQRTALAHLGARLQTRHPSREIERQRGHLAHLAARLRTLGPQGTLDRGYALVLDEENRPVSQLKKADEGKSIRLVLSKGVAAAAVTEASPGKTLLETLGSIVTPKKKSLRRKNREANGKSGTQNKESSP